MALELDDRFRRLLQIEDSQDLVITAKNNILYLLCLILIFSIKKIFLIAIKSTKIEKVFIIQESIGSKFFKVFMKVNVFFYYVFYKLQFQKEKWRHIYHINPFCISNFPINTWCEWLVNVNIIGTLIWLDFT